MRLSYLVLIAGTAMLMNGCSMLIARSGKDLSNLTTKEKIHREFGEPDKTGVVEGHPCEDYCTRRKISEPIESSTLELAIGMSYGMAELVAFPLELYLQGRRTVVGQTLRFVYDDNGQVMRVFLDGEKLYLSYNLDGLDAEKFDREKKAEQAQNQPPANSP